MPMEKCQRALYWVLAALVLRTANCPASLAGCSLAYQARLPCAEPAAYLLRMVLRGSRSRARRILMRPRPHAYGRSHACKVCSVHG